VCHVNSGALVAHIHDVNALGVKAHPDGHDVPAAQRKHTLNPNAAALSGVTRGELMGAFVNGVMA
jgi:hypothetical protein